MQENKKKKDKMTMVRQRYPFIQPEILMIKESYSPIEPDAHLISLDQK